jgi:PleD family two-component response regulator
MNLNSPLAEVLLPFYEEFVNTHCARQTELSRDVIVLMLLGITDNKTVLKILARSGHEEAIKERKSCFLRKLQHKHRPTVARLELLMRERKD